jgi:hypothetical protein
MYAATSTLRRAGVLLAVVMALIAVAAVAPAAGAAKLPPCTKQALTAGLKRGTAKVPGGKIYDRTFGCAGSYAYAAVNTKFFTLTAVFRASGSSWVTINRTKPCKKRVIPKRIYKRACLTS